MNYIPILLLICVLTAGCRNKQESNSKQFGVLDTAHFILQANIREFASEIPDAFVGKLERKTLAYIAFACDCPNYVVLSDKDSNNLYREEFYIEPASENLIIPGELAYNMNEFELTGIITEENGWPSFNKFMDPDPPNGRVFTYWAYKVKRPYMFWGPLHYWIDSCGDTVESASRITVR
ncbi:MAG TPA: hypothetical protein VI731_08875 [Bacteroidia bacterium]|nr:hypothetical protein [Bacteroidia bacterium]